MIQIHSIHNGIFPCGMYAGMQAIVVNVGGCNRHCSFCDFKYDDNLVDMDDEEIFKRIIHVYYEIGVAFNPKILFTGGEPGLWDFEEVIKSFADYEFTDISVTGNPIKKKKSPLFFVATNGLEWHPWFDFCTILLSPKANWIDMAHRTKSNASEIHFVVGGDLPRYWEEPQYNDLRGTMYLVPLWEEDKRRYNENIKMALRLVKKNPLFRLSLNLNHHCGGLHV